MGCVFCQIIRKETPANIVYENREVIAFLDKYPQTRGHLQLVPKAHHRWIYELPDIGQFFVTAQAIIRVIIPVLEANHVTLGTFGHEIEHAHLWIVPQYKKSVQIAEGFKKEENSSLELSQLLKNALNFKF